MDPHRRWYKYMKLSTIRRLEAIHPDDIDSDEFINRLIDHYIGLDCKHVNQHLYLRLPADENRMLDKDRSFKLLNDICYGKEIPELVRGCPDCGRMSVVHR